MSLDFEALTPKTRSAVERLARKRGWTLEQALEEVVIEGIAMGGLTKAGRPLASVTQIRPPLKRISDRDS